MSHHRWKRVLIDRCCSRFNRLGCCRIGLALHFLTTAPRAKRFHVQDIVNRQTVGAVFTEDPIDVIEPVVPEACPASSIRRRNESRESLGAVDRKRKAAAGFEMAL